MYNKLMDINRVNQLKTEHDKYKKYSIISGAIMVGAIFLFNLWIFSSIIKIGAIRWLPARFMSIMIAVLFMGAGVATIISVIRYNKRYKEYRDAYKQYFSEKALAKTLDKYEYHPKLGIEKSTLKELNCLHFGNIYRSEDLVIGEHHRVKLSQADLEIIYEQHTKDGTVRETYFKGRWTIAAYPKKFESKLIIVGSRLRGFVRCPSGFHQTEVESIEFNKRFKIYAKDGREMFYLLNPKIIERMQELAEKYSNYIVFVFDDQKLHIGVNAPNSFEPPRTSGPLDEVNEVNRLAEEASLITKLIDELDLDKKLFAA